MKTHSQLSKPTEVIIKALGVGAMLNQISVFSAKADIEVALTLVCWSAFAMDRSQGPLSLEKIKDLLVCKEGVEALFSLKRRLNVADFHPPSEGAMAELFDDAILSSQALKLHGGRDVYGQTKIALWNALWDPLRSSLCPPLSLVKRLGELIALDTSPEGADVEVCVELLQNWLEKAGFEFERIQTPGERPIIRAHREARGMRGHIVLYGHYDVDELREEEWDTPPLQLTEHSGRLYGVGIGDNKAPLALRIEEFGQMQRCPAITWLMQGDEETGSAYAHQVFPEILQDMVATLWLEENGYHDNDGTQRYLAREIEDPGRPATDKPPKGEFSDLLTALNNVGQNYGITSRLEVRSLNKSFFASGCPWGRNLPSGARYLALGVNDPASNIHRPNESVPMWTLPIHRAQLNTIMQWVDAVRT